MTQCKLTQQWESHVIVFVAVFGTAQPDSQDMKKMFFYLNFANLQVYFVFYDVAVIIVARHLLRLLLINHAKRML